MSSPATVEQIIAANLLRIRTNLSKEDLLPHFTPFLAVQLQCRLKTRILEDGVPAVNASSRDFLAHEIAGQLVDRIFRTQLKEAKATLSFADAMIRYDESVDRGSKDGSNAGAVGDAPNLMDPTGEAQPSLVIPFRSRRARHARSA